MKKVSKRLEHVIDRLYNSVGSLSYIDPEPTLINYSLNNVFPAFFRVSLQGNKVEIPMFARQCVQTHLIDMLNDESNSAVRKDIIIHFHPTTVTHTSNRTVNTLIEHLVEYYPGMHGMYTNGCTNKGESYYGCKGTIFNEDMTLILFNTIECKIEGKTLIYKKLKSYIHPSVFYSEGTIEKCIAEKIVPFILQNGINFRSYNSDVVNDIKYSTNETISRTIPELVITDITDKFFCKPILPSVNYSNDDINDVLDRNIEDIFSIMRL